MLFDLFEKQSIPSRRYIPISTSRVKTSLMDAEQRMASGDRRITLRVMFGHIGY